MVVHLYNELNGITIFQFQISQHVFVKLVSPMHSILWAAGDGLFAFQVLRILNLIVYSIKSLLEKKKKSIFSLVVAKNLNYLMQFWIIFTAKQNYFFPISLFVKIFYDQKNIRSVKKRKKKSNTWVNYPLSNAFYKAPNNQMKNQLTTPEKMLLMLMRFQILDLLYELLWLFGKSS